MEDRTLFDLRREENELRVRLAHIQADIQRREHDLWREFQAQRDAAIREMDSRSDPTNGWCGTREQAIATFGKLAEKREEDSQ